MDLKEAYNTFLKNGLRLSIEAHLYNSKSHQGAYKDTLEKILSIILSQDSFNEKDNSLIVKTLGNFIEMLPKKKFAEDNPNFRLILI